MVAIDTLLLKEESMLQKFKMTTYTTLLLITVFVLPYAGNVTAEGDDVTKAVETLDELCTKKLKNKFNLWIVTLEIGRASCRERV